MSGVGTDDAENVAAFLKELTALTHKYGIKIDGCGCCGSPNLADTDTSEEGFSYHYGDSRSTCDLDFLAPIPVTIEGSAKPAPKQIEGEK